MEGDFYVLKGRDIFRVGNSELQWNVSRYWVLLTVCTVDSGVWTTPRTEWACLVYDCLDWRPLACRRRQGFWKLFLERRSTQIQIFNIRQNSPSWRSFQHSTVVEGCDNVCCFYLVVFCSSTNQCSTGRPKVESREKLQQTETRRHPHQYVSSVSFNIDSELYY